MGHSGAPRHATVSSPANYIQLIYIGGIDSLFDVWRYLCSPILPFFSFLVFLSEAEGAVQPPATATLAVRLCSKNTFNG